MSLYIFTFFVAIILTSISQVILKKAAIEEAKKIKYILYIIGFFCFGLITIFSTYSLRFISFKDFAAWSSLSYVLVVILSYIFLQEEISKYKIMGTFIIIIGILVFQLL